MQLETIFPFVTACFGEGNERFSEFNLRDTPAGAGSMKMGFHHDAALGKSRVETPSRCLSRMISSSARLPNCRRTAFRHTRPSLQIRLQ